MSTKTLGETQGAVHVVTLTLDAEGGDSAPAEIVAGALLAASAELKILLVGRPAVIQPHLKKADLTHIELVPSASVVSSYQEPAAAVRNMQDSSIVVGARTVAEGRSQGLVSAGSTGAVLAASVIVMKRVKGVRRPAIITTLPGKDGPIVMLDAGANSDCGPEHLLEFGVLGVAYARAVLGRVQPRVGLLNIGEEEGKGNAVAVAAHQLLKASDLPFIGNVEGRDLLTSKADVIVTDGFTGNVALKALEGSALAIMERMKEAVSARVVSKAGGLLMRSALRDVREQSDPETYGGTHLLGVRGLTVICHGNSTRVAVANALRFGADALRRGVLQAVEREVAVMLGDPDTSAES